VVNASETTAYHAVVAGSNLVVNAYGTTTYHAVVAGSNPADYLKR
jgi:hypothetical protein